MRTRACVTITLILCFASNDVLGSTNRVKRAAVADNNRLWPRGVVPYVIGSAITRKVHDLIYKAFKEWESETCIRFVPRQFERNYVLFNVSDCGCCSSVGRRGGEQILSLSEFCVDQSVAIHEIGHTLGFFHEQSRPDRDQYVNIFPDNIIREKRHNFRKLMPNETRPLDQPYDYHSIMHYKEKTFALTKQHSVIAAKRHDISLSNRHRLSPGDVAKTMLLYNCPHPSCNHVLNGSIGEFTSPYYPAFYLPNVDCSWTIPLRPDEYISLEFLHFDVAESFDCFQDRVEIFELRGAIWKRLVTMCHELKSVKRDGMEASASRSPPLSIHEGTQMQFFSSRPLTITFHTDYRVSRTGFLATYKRLPITQAYLRGLSELEMLHRAIETPTESTEIIGSGSGESPTELEIAVEESSGDTEPPGVVVEEITVPNFLYKPKDCWKFLTERKGAIESPYIPMGLQAEVRCQWFIETEALANFTLNFESNNQSDNCGFTLYVRESATYETEDRIVWLSIPWIDSEETAALYNFQAKTLNCSSSARIESTGLVITWSSRYQTPFLLTYHQDEDECAMNTHLCGYKCEDQADGYVCHCPRNGEIYRPLKPIQTMSFSALEKRRETLLRHHCVEKQVEKTSNCGAYLVRSRGVLRSSTEFRPNCSWTFSYATLEQPSHFALLLFFNAFRVLPAGPTCPNASLDIMVGRTVRAVFCGEGQPRTSNFYDVSVTLNLRTSDSLIRAANGHSLSLNYFSLRYLIVNRSSVARALRPTVVRVGKSPVMVENERENGVYLPYAFSSWRITTLRDRGSLDCQFIDVDIEETTECYFDYVEVSTRTGQSVTGRLCGYQQQLEPFSVANNAIVTFTSDETINRRGFRLQCVANYGD